MAISKEDLMSGYFYAACPYCKATLIQGRNGTECLIKCPQCGKYIHIVIKDDAVLTKIQEI